MLIMAPFIFNSFEEKVSLIKRSFRKFISQSFSNPQCKVDDNGDPTDELTPLAVEFCRKHGVTAGKVSEIIDNKEPVIYKVIQEGVDRVNAKAISNAQKVQKWTLLLHDFSISGGELGKDLLISTYMPWIMP